jgi:hypothetical protein
LLALICFFRFARLVFGDGRALAATAILAFTPLVFYFSSSIQPEAILLLASYGALWAWVSYLRSRRWGALAAWALAMTVVLGIKPQNILLLVPMVVLAGDARRQGQWSWRGPALAFALALVVPVLWFWHGHHIYLQTHNSFGITTSGGADKFSIGLHLRTASWWFHVGRDLLVFVVLLPVLPFFFMGLVRAWREYRFLAVWTAIVLLSFILLAEAVVTMQYYDLPLAAPAALLVTLGLESAWQATRRRFVPSGWGGALALLAVVLLAVGLAGAVGLLGGLAAAPGLPLARALEARGVGPEEIRQMAHHLARRVSLALLAFGAILAVLTAWRWRANARQPGLAPLGAAGALVLLLVTAWPFATGYALRVLWRGEYAAQYEAGVRLRAFFAPRTLGVLGHQVYKRPHGYDPEPVIFYYANMRGWIVPEINYTEGRLDTLIGKGARFFATTHLSVLDRNPGFEAALERRGALLERTRDYALYRLGPPPPATP